MITLAHIVAVIVVILLIVAVAAVAFYFTGRRKRQLKFSDVEDQLKIALKGKDLGISEPMLIDVLYYPIGVNFPVIMVVEKATGKIHMIALGRILMDK